MRNSPTLPDLVEHSGKKLNPPFVEWVMGYPKNFTKFITEEDLEQCSKERGKRGSKLWETLLYRKLLNSSGKNFRVK